MVFNPESSSQIPRPEQSPQQDADFKAGAEAAAVVYNERILTYAMGKTITELMRMRTAVTPEQEPFLSLLTECTESLLALPHRIAMLTSNPAALREVANGKTLDQAIEEIQRQSPKTDQSI